METADRPQTGAPNETAAKPSESGPKQANFFQIWWQKFKNRRKLPLEARKWLLFSVFYTIIAVPLAVIYDLIRGFRFEQLKLDWLPDILLVNFAVSVNVISLVEDKKTYLSQEDNFRYLHHPYFIMIITFCIYSFIYRDEDIATQIVFIILALSAAILLINIRMGIRIIDKSSAHTKNQESSEGGN